MFDFLDDLFSIVVDVVETAGSIVVDTVEFAGSVAADAIDIAVDVAEGSFNVAGDITTGLGIVANDGYDLTGEMIAGLIAAIFGSNSSDEQREQAEHRCERQLTQLRGQSKSTVKQYQQQQQKVYEQKANAAQQQQFKKTRQLALRHLKQERATINDFIDQLKPRRQQLKHELAKCKTTAQHTSLEQEYQALNRLYQQLKKQLKRINANTQSITHTA